VFFTHSYRKFRYPGSQPVVVQEPAINTLAVMYGNVLQDRIKQFGDGLRSETTDIWSPRRVEMAVRQIFDDWCSDRTRHSWDFLGDINRFYCGLEESTDPLYPKYVTVYYSHDTLQFLRGKLDNDGNPYPA